MDVFVVATVSSVATVGASAQYNITMSAAASDATYDEAAGVLVQVPIGVTEDEMNSRLFNAVVDWVRTLHGWSVKSENVFITSTFRRG